MLKCQEVGFKLHFLIFRYVLNHEKHILVDILFVLNLANFNQYLSVLYSSVYEHGWWDWAGLKSHSPDYSGNTSAGMAIGNVQVDVN